MKKLLIITLVFFIYGCATRKTQHTSEEVKLNDNTKITTERLGDFIILPAPLTPKDRPVSETKSYKGNKGATANLNFDDEGNFDGGIILCPNEKVLEERNLKLQYELDEKKTQRQLVEFTVKELSSLILYITSIICLAWVIRSFFNRKK